MAGAAVSRIERLAALLDEPLLVTSGVNVRYLTGLVSSNAAMLVEPGGEATLFTDFRYAQKARALDGVRFEQTARAVIGDLATRLAGRTIWIEAHVLTVAANEQLREGGVETVAQTGLVERLRAIKEPAEIEAMRAAAGISDRVFGALAEEQFTGRTERELAWRVRELFHEQGASELAFDTIVAAAENGASPHADVRDAEIPGNTLVTIDAGCRVDGYASDCTRTFATGELPDELARAYEVCLEAQLAGLDAYGPGVSGRDADAAARNVIAAAGWGEQFGHGLGHGIGLDVHELPAARAESTDTIESGNVLSCEPGIYLPGVGGVRIEDMVLVTDEGSEQLTRAQRADDRQVTSAAVADVVSTNEFKNGMHIELEGSVWRIVEFQHVKPGKGGAFVRTKVKSVDSGSVVDKTFRAGEKFPRVFTEVKNMQYLYDSGDEVVFMDESTYEQMSLPHASLEAELPLQPSTPVQLLFVGGKPSGVQLPSSIELQVSDTEPGVKGDTVSNVTKPATLETGAIVAVPLFVNPGDRIKVDPREGRYISRA